ncbi:hypothetical protein PR003_g31949 [Phytophthora rubi]|uniref:RxLR effector protein n=1 Tax=Phytophthora rubi TaxID=129364 RepID=A0A6A3GIS6_9STRA|nr:hypothetical protein PR002_g30762 [Phytophthora rubi]KAE8959355.1 hypothetical protein PR001_g30739 [Phytophthora rubi]KAE9266935.1 hypothetical protein PR003_g31949 [Phytophthora rubi]
MTIRFRQATLVAIAAFLVSANTLAAAETKPNFPQSPHSAYALKAGRSLRLDGGVDTDNDEERAWGDFSSLKSNVRKIFSRKAGKVQLPAPKHKAATSHGTALDLQNKQ